MNSMSNQIFARREIELIIIIIRSIDAEHNYRLRKSKFSQERISQHYRFIKNKLIINKIIVKEN